MDEMIKAITRAANAVAVYYENTVKFADAQIAPAAPTEPVVTPRTRKPKAEPKAPEAAVPAPVASAAPAAMNEKESEDRLKVVGEAFVQRFSKQGDAVDEVKKTIESKFKISRLRDLVHAQRVELIAILEARIKEIDSKPVQSVAPAAVGLGL